MAASLLAAAANAQTPLRVLQTFPAANVIMDGSNTRFSVMFEGPVDHASSRLVIEQDDKQIQVLIPRLSSQPNTLYSNGRPLAPGHYILRWEAHGPRGGAMSIGGIPFTVGPAQ